MRHDTFTRTGALFGSWKVWAERRNFPVGTETAFSDVLADKGFIRHRMTNGRGFRGIMLKPEDNGSPWEDLE
jgi:hypothetical protein